MFSIRYFLAHFKNLTNVSIFFPSGFPGSWQTSYFFISLLSYFIDNFIKIGKFCSKPLYYRKQKLQDTWTWFIYACKNILCICYMYILNKVWKNRKSFASLQLNLLAFIILNVPNLEYSPSPWAFTASSNTFITIK